MHMNLQNAVKIAIIEKKFVVLSLIIVALSCNFAYATNYSTSLFSNSTNIANSNSYQNSEYHFSFNPPPNWKLLKDVPADVANNAIAMFSDNIKNNLATLVIFHRTISNQVIDAINTHTDKEVLDELVNEMSSKSQESQTDILKAGIERYVDGTRILTFSSTTYSSDNSTSYSANMIYYLDTGEQYTIVLTSNPERFDQDLELFKNSIDTFYVSTSNKPINEINIPAWIKNNAKWWADGTINDEEFAKGIEYLITNGMLKI